MEHEKLEYKVVMDDGADTVVLARLVDFELSAAAYMAAIAKHPARNVYLRQGARIIKQNLGEPNPGTETPPDPALPDWDVRIIRGSNMDFRGTVMAKDVVEAKARAIEQFKLTDQQVKRLVLSRRR
jgi:hypothetical protein